MDGHLAAEKMSHHIAEIVHTGASRTFEDYDKS